MSEHSVGAVVCIHAKDMKEPWCLASSLGNATARQIVEAYAKRWTIEPSFRDTKDIRFGMGLSQLPVSRPDRRDRLLLLNAFAIHLLTMLGTAGEELGMDRHLKSNTSKRRTHSLFPSGLHARRTYPRYAGRSAPTPHAALRRRYATAKRNPETGCSFVK